MRRTFPILKCFVLILTLLAFVGPVHAEAAAGAAPVENMDNIRAEHRQLREERQKLRDEHEALEAESDRLKVICMDAKGQDRTECEKKHHDLHARKQDWHQRMKKFHEKAQAEWHKHPVK